MDEIRQRKPRSGGLKLKVQEENFCHEYLSNGMNGPAAAQTVGYSSHRTDNTAYKLLKKPHIIKRIKELQDKRARRLELRGDIVLQDINEIAEEARASGNFMAAIKGKELLGKHLRLFAERVEHTVVAESVDAYNALSVDDKIAFHKQAIKQIQAEAIAKGIPLLPDNEAE